jgi:hypothetical protein
MANTGSTQRLPLIPELIRALEAAYHDRQNTELRTTARERALAYDHKLVFEQYMKPALLSFSESAQAETDRLQPVKVAQ